MKILNLALSGIKLYIKIKTALRTAKLARITAALAAPTPGGAKPTAGPDLISVITSLDNLNNASKKVDTYQAAITAVSAFTNVFKEILTKLKLKISQLQLIIVSPTTPVDTSGTNTEILNAQLAESKNSVPTQEDYTSAGGRSYILKLVTLPNKQRQYQALDSFSKLKITQTAPSRIKTDAQLLDEIKSILG